MRNNSFFILVFVLTFIININCAESQKMEVSFVARKNLRDNMNLVTTYNSATKEFIDINDKAACVILTNRKEFEKTKFHDLDIFQSSQDVKNILEENNLKLENYYFKNRLLDYNEADSTYLISSKLVHNKPINGFSELVKVSFFVLYNKTQNEVVLVDWYLNNSVWDKRHHGVFSSDYSTIYYHIRSSLYRYDLLKKKKEQINTGDIPFSPSNSNDVIVYDIENKYFKLLDNNEAVIGQIKSDDYNLFDLYKVGLNKYVLGIISFEIFSIGPKNKLYLFDFNTGEKSFYFKYYDLFDVVDVKLE